MTDRLAYGIMGTGNIARQFAEGVAGSQRSRIAAVGSRTADSAKAFAKQHEIATAHASYEALIADDHVDAIYVSLPNTMHAEWSIKALEAGKHVLCEKPLAVTAADAERMFAAAKVNDRVLVEAFMYRCHPLTIAVLEQLRSGAIGELRLIRCSFNYCTNKIEGNVRFDEALAGGGLMDIGCYCTNFAMLMAGQEPTAVHATGHLHETHVDDMAAGTLTFPSGLIASFTCGMRAHANNTAYLCGTEGFIDIPIPWKPPVEGAEFTVRTMNPPRMDQDKADSGPTQQTYKVDAPAPLYGMEADAFAAVVFDGADPFMSEADSLVNARVLDTMRQQIGLSF